jgi:hypothetical protein
MDRQPGSLLLLAQIALGASMMGASITACGGSGPPIAEHPRSSGMAAVAPESDPLAGTLVVRPGEARAPRVVASTPARVRALALPARADLVSTRTSRVVIDEGAWNLALGGHTTDTGMAPDVALSAALTLSGGAAPRLGEPASSIAILHVSEEAVEEGAWEASRR